MKVGGINDNRILVNRKGGSKPSQLLCHSLRTIALLDTKAARAVKDASVLCGGYRKEDRPEIGTVPNVDRGRSLTEHFKIAPIHAVTLNAVLAKSPNDNLTAKQSERIQKGRIGIIPLHLGFGRTVALSAANEEGMLILPDHLYAKGTKCINGQIDIGPAFNGGRNTNRAIPLHHWECEKQTADKLAADIAYYGIFARSQRALHKDTLSILKIDQALLLAEHTVNVHRTLHQALAPAEHDVPSGKQRDGDHKAKRASALIAGKNPLGRGASHIPSEDGNRIPVPLAFRAESA